MLQDRLPVKFQDVKFKDPKFQHEIFMRIDMKHSYFSIIRGGPVQPQTVLVLKNINVSQDFLFESYLFWD